MEKIRCNLCTQENSQLLFDGYNFLSGEKELLQLVKCLNCGLIYNNPRPDDKEILKYYTQEYYGYRNIKFRGIIEELIHLFRRRRVKEARLYKETGRILDIGCGRGIFLNYMRVILYKV